MSICATGLSTEDPKDDHRDNLEEHKEPGEKHRCRWRRCQTIANEV